MNQKTQTSLGCKFALLTVLIVAAACAPMTPVPFKLNQGNSDKQKKTKPACEVDPAEYLLSAEILDFQMGTNEFGANISLPFLNSYIQALKGFLTVKSGQMLVKTTIRKSINPQMTLAEQLGAGKLNQTDLGASIKVSDFDIGFNFYHETPIFKLTEKSLAKSFKNSMQEFTDKYSFGDWKTKAYPNGYPDEVAIPVGRNVGIREGDEFKIANVIPQWKGTPCESQFIDNHPTTEKPLAIGKVKRVNDSGAVLEIIERNQTTSEEIETGAEVSIHVLRKEKGEKDRRLLMAARIAELDSAKIEIPNEDGSSKNQLHLLYLMSRQYKIMVQKHGFYVP